MSPPTEDALVSAVVWNNRLTVLCWTFAIVVVVVVVFDDDTERSDLYDTNLEQTPTLLMTRMIVITVNIVISSMLLIFSHEYAVVGDGPDGSRDQSTEVVFGTDQIIIIIMMMIWMTMSTCCEVGLPLQQQQQHSLV